MVEEHDSVPRLLHRDKLEPSFVRAFGVSIGVHVVIIALVVGAALYGSHRISPISHNVGIVDAPPGSPLLEIGPLGSGSGTGGAPMPGAVNTGAPPIPDDAAARAAEEAAQKAAQAAVEKAAAEAAAQQTARNAAEEAARQKAAADEAAHIAAQQQADVAAEQKAATAEAKKAEDARVAALRAQEAAKVKAAEEAATKKAADDAAKKTAAAEAAKKQAAAAAAKKKAAEEAAKKKAADEVARKKAAEEAAKKQAAEAEAKRKADELASQKATAEAAARSKAAAEKAEADARVATARGPGAIGATGPGGTGDPSEGPGGGGGGGGGGGDVRGIEFVRYYEQMINRIRANWVYVGDDQSLAVTVRFSIQPDGRVINVRRSDSSGNVLFDQSVESAVRGVRDLGSPPQQYARDFSDVEVTFRAKDLAQ